MANRTFYPAFSYGFGRVYVEAVGGPWIFLEAGRVVPHVAGGFGLVAGNLTFGPEVGWLDPHAIVCGGGLSNIERLYAEIPLRWTRYVFSDAVRTPLLRARFGDSSGVRGAAWLFPLLP